MYTLIYKPDCPFCQKVLAFIDEHDIEVELKDLQKQEHINLLMEKGGKRQVPFLIDHEKEISMYESDDIIAYLTAEMEI